MAKIIFVFILMSFVFDVIKAQTDTVGVWADGKKPKFCKKYDCAKYTVVSRFEDFEERLYDASTWLTTTVVSGSYKTARRTMFWRLFRYIRGNNEAGQKIDMTIPVTFKFTPKDGSTGEKTFQSSFFVSPSAGALSAPKDQTVVVNNMAPFTVYVRVFGGFAKKYRDWADQAETLSQSLKREGLNYESNSFYTAGYDSPWTMVKRHNEVWMAKK